MHTAWRAAAQQWLSGDIDPNEAIDLAVRLLDADPLDEDALRHYLRWLARTGQATRARQAYQDFASRLRTELGLAPAADLTALLDSPGTATPIGKGAVRPSQPARDDSFVGRAVELRRIGDLLSQNDCRLLSVIGPGGVGKTRLAQRVAQELAARFDSGATFIPLDDLATEAELGGWLARTLDLDLNARGDPLDRVIEALRPAHRLLVLDNFEHLVAGTPVLERILVECPQVKLVVTSRVRLGLTLEWLLPVQGLPCPDEEDVENVEAFDAARLFIRAARRVHPEFTPATEPAAIIDICKQVEGLPLALELAAAWTRILSCSAIATELHRGTELLHARDASHSTRHAGMDVVFDQSWRRLTTVERDALSRLSVFRGGFSAEAARAVTGASLPVLGALVDKSLMRKDGTRLYMHALVQELVARRGDESGAREAAEHDHSRYFLHRTTQSRRTVEDGDREALRWMETEFENLRRAWSWSAAHGAHDQIAASALTLLYFCDHRGRFNEGLSLLDHARATLPEGADSTVRALLMSVAAHFLFRLDRYADAEASAERALAASRGDRDRDATLQCLKVLGSCRVRVGRYADAKRYFRQALGMTTEDTDPHNTGVLYDNLAICEKRTGNFEEALRLSLQSLALHRRSGNVAGEAASLGNLGNLYYELGEPEAARVHLLDGLAVCDRHGLVRTRGIILASLTRVAIRMNALDLADDYAKRAVEIARTVGDRGPESFVRTQRVGLALRRGDVEAARSELAASLAISLAVGSPSLQLAGIAAFAELLRAQGEPGCAFSILRFAAEQSPQGSPERAEMQALLEQWRDAGSAAPSWPGLGLEDLAHRVIAEAGVAFGPLIALLRDER